MNAIESVAKLPNSALSWEDYVRFYAYRPDGSIAVLYTTPFESDRSFFEDGIREYCEERGDQYPKCLDDYDKVFTAKAGERHWLEDYQNLPIPEDGGCGVIQFSFRKSTGQITTPKCNGGV